MSHCDPIRVTLEPVRELIGEALVTLDGGSDLEDVVALIRERIPPDEAGRWLVAARILMNCAVGVAEGWLDAHDLDDEVRDTLIANLLMIMPEGIGEELTPRRLTELQADVADRPVARHEVAIPLLFVIGILAMNADPNVEGMLLLDLGEPNSPGS